MKKVLMLAVSLMLVAPAYLGACDCKKEDHSKCNKKECKCKECHKDGKKTEKEVKKEEKK